MVGRSDTPDLYVLDALVNDTEDLESIIRMLNSDTMLGWTKHWGREFERAEIVVALSRLISNDFVRVLGLSADGKLLEEHAPKRLPRETYDDVYFMITDRGRLVHQNWEPAV